MGLNIQLVVIILLLLLWVAPSNAMDLDKHEKELQGLQDELKEKWDQTKGAVLPSLTHIRYHTSAGESTIGEGGSCVVKLGNFDPKSHIVYHKNPETLFAVKKVEASKWADSEVENRTNMMINELKALISLNKRMPYSPWITELEYVLWERSTDKSSMIYYLIMELVEGGELEDLQHAVGKMTENIARFYIAQMVFVAEAVHQTHIYRDFKPENFFVTGKAYLKLGDFGFADDGSKMLNGFMGTIAFLAPELAKKVLGEGPERMYNKEVDMWSLAAMIYELLAGVELFPDGEKDDPEYEDQDDPEENAGTLRQLRKIISQPIEEKIRSLDISDQLMQILLGMLNRENPTKRPTASELKANEWFDGINWNKLAAQKYKQPYFPVRAHASPHLPYKNNGAPVYYNNAPVKPELKHYFSRLSKQETTPVAGSVIPLNEMLALEEATKFPNLPKKLTYKTRDSRKPATESDPDACVGCLTGWIKTVKKVRGKGFRHRLGLVTSRKS